MILTVHSFDTKGFGVKVELPDGEILEWKDGSDFHKSYQRTFNGDARLQWKGSAATESVIVWSVA